jgi:ankyrin repeat protein
LKPRTPFLARETVKRHLDQLDTRLVAVEKDLNIAYNDIFERNATKDTLEYYHASKIYKMLLCYKQPLSTATVTTAVAFNEDNSPGHESIDHVYIRRLTQDFIIETERGTLEFAHVSVKDYLQGENQSDYSDAKSHAQVARMCLKYIASQDQAAYEVAIQSNTFLQYSQRFWGEHCAQLSKEDRQILRVSKELLDWIIEGSGSTTFQHWLHAAEKFPRFSTRSWNSDSGSPVFSACDWNLVEVLEKLLLADPAYDLDLNPDDRGHTPLSLAAYRGHKAVVELLLRTKKVEVDSKDGEHRTPLLRAAHEGHDEVVKLLLKEGANMEAADVYGWTILHWASLSGRVEIVKLLLEKKANIEAADTEGWTPLHWAAQDGQDEVVKLLLKEGANMEAANTDGWTTLHWAAQNGHVEIVKLLLEKGADTAAADTDRQTTLHWASRSGHVEIVKLLLEKGAHTAAADTEGWTPLHGASRNGHVEIIKLLLKKGAVITAADTDGQTPLHLASASGHVEIVKLLLQEGADITAADTDGLTPLHWASENGHVEVVELLLKRGAAITAADTIGQTPLHLASENGHVEIVKLLLQEGADITAADTDGLTPLHWASWSGYDEVVQLLSGSG